MDCNSKMNRAKDGLEAELTCPNIDYMKQKYGNDSLLQMQIWIDICGFRSVGSFCCEIMKSLCREKLLHDLENNRCKLGWMAFQNWMEAGRVKEKWILEQIVWGNFHLFPHRFTIQIVWLFRRQTLRWVGYSSVARSG